MFYIVLIVMSAFWFLGGWFFGRSHEMKKAWRRGLYEHSQLPQDDNNPPGSL